MPSSTTNGVNGVRPLDVVAANKDMLYKGLSFTPEERIARNLTGLIPHTLESLQTQCARAMRMIETRQTGIDKYLYLSTLKDQNVDLFYRLLIDNIRELMPLVYTPTIGDVCLQYSTLYTRPESLYISIKQQKSIRTMLRNWPYPHPEICVVTDGSRILGLGDLGINGVGISVSAPPCRPPTLHFLHIGSLFDRPRYIAWDIGLANCCRGSREIVNLYALLVPLPLPCLIYLSTTFLY